MHRKDQFLENTLSGGSAERPDRGYTPVVRDDAEKHHVAPPSTAYVRRGEDAGNKTTRGSPDFRSQSCVSSANGDAAIELSLIGLFVKPWAYKWVLVFGGCLILSVMFYVIAQIAPSVQARLLYAIAMSVCVPATMCCLFVEWDVTKSVRWHSALLVAVVGGCVSASIAEGLNAYFNVTIDNARMAALTEEPTKGLILIALLFFVKRFPTILSGLALGCAVGAGFAVCETVEYAYAYGEGSAPSVEVLALRGALSPMMHMAWTGVLGAALWSARGVTSNWRGVVFSWPAWIVLMGMIMFHVIWNSVGLVNILVFVLWGLILYYVRRGIYQADEFNLVRKVGIK